MTNLGEENHVIQLNICPTEIIERKKSTKVKVVKDIVECICGLLNSGGGKLELTCENNTPKNHIHECIRKIEQKLLEIIGCATMVSKIKDEVSPNRIDFLVEPSVCFHTVNYHLFLPTKAQVIPALPTDSVEEIKGIMKQPSLVSELLELHEKEFVKGEHVDLEEDTNVQFKCLKASPSKCSSLADRMVNNKLACHLSAFANHNGGNIYYGIMDNGVVEGEKITEEDKELITKRVDKTIRNMIWPDDHKHPKRGQEWQIYFEPVKDSEGKPIDSEFVIVVAVPRCSGGVFVAKPEAYHIKNGKVVQMSFEVWKTKLMASACESENERKRPLELPKSSDTNTKKMRLYEQASRPSSAPVNQRPSPCLTFRWSSEKNRNLFIRLTTGLIKYRNCDDMKQFSKVSKLAIERFQNSDARLVVKAEEIAVAYKNHNFHKTDRLLKELSSSVKKSADATIFDARVLYLRSRIERAKGNFEKSYVIAKDALQIIQLIPAGFITVWSYMHAAFLAAILSSRERGPRKHDLKNEERKFLECAQKDALALNRDNQALLIDLEQKLHIYQAMSALGCLLTGEAFEGSCATQEGLDCAARHLSQVHCLILKGHVLSYFRDIQYMLVQSDLLRRRVELTHPINRVEILKYSFKLVEDAKSLAEAHSFKEMIEYSGKRLAKYEDCHRNSHGAVGRCDDDALLKDLGMENLSDI